MDNSKKIKHSQDYWNVSNSGKRLFHKLKPNRNGEYNTVKLCEDDFNALKSILGYINRVENKTVANNNVMAKLYIMELVGQIRDNETTIFNEAIFTNLSKQLSKPLDLFYKAFYEDLCSNQLNRLTEKNISDVDAQEYLLDYTRFKETFSLQYVTDKLDEMINLTLNRRS